MAVMPLQKPGRSEQVVCTPPEFLQALKSRLGISQFDIDVAADESNHVAEVWYGPGSGFNSDGLQADWCITIGWNWCNPPFGNIQPWVQKGFEEAVRGAKTAMLVPASTGANWWAEYVNGIAHVLLLQGRLTFVGHTTPYPKDLALLLYSPIVWGGYEVWKWKETTR